MTVFGYLILTSIYFYDFISRYTLVLVSNEKINQTLKTVFDHIAKYLEARQIYSATRRIFKTTLVVWKCFQTPSFVFDILLSVG